MTAAGHRLNLAQPTVSRQIRLLEEELGVQLLERGDRAVRLTLKGQLFFEYAQKILSLVQKAQKAVQSLPSSLEGSFSAATINYLGLSLVAPVVHRFLQPGHSFQMRLSYGSARDIIEKMKRQEVDMAVLPDLREEYGTEIPYYESHFLFQDPMLFVGSKKDTSLPEKISLSEMNQRPLVSFADMFPKFNLYLEKKQGGARVQPFFEINNLGSLKRMIEWGRYWGFMPAFSIQKQMRFGRLAPVKVEGVDYKINICMYHLRSVKNKELIDTFLFMLKKLSSSKML